MLHWLGMWQRLLISSKCSVSIITFVVGNSAWCDHMHEEWYGYRWVTWPRWHMSCTTQRHDWQKVCCCMQFIGKNCPQLNDYSCHHIIQQFVASASTLYMYKHILPCIYTSPTLTGISRHDSAVCKFTLRSNYTLSMTSFNQNLSFIIWKLHHHQTSCFPGAISSYRPGSQFLCFFL